MKYLKYLNIVALWLLSCCSKSNDTRLSTIVIEGAKYATVKIGAQTWTIRNYNGPGGENYNDSPSNNPTYGKLYTHAEAAAVVLPPGWRLPSIDDFNKLFVAVGGSAIDETKELASPVTVTLMSKTTWTMDGGSNLTGWNATAGGLYVQADPPSYFDKGNRAVFLTSSFLNNVFIYANIYFNGGGTNSTIGVGGFNSDMNDRGSIRFVKDN
jgi:uncharacterized protein (TIGR02145 family)